VVRIRDIEGREGEGLVGLTFIGRLEDVLTTAVFARVPAEAVPPDMRDAMAKKKIEVWNRIFLRQSQAAHGLGVG